IPYYDHPSGQWINWVRRASATSDRDIWRAHADGSMAEALTGAGAEDTKIVGWSVVSVPGSTSGGAATNACVPRPATCSPNPPPCPLGPGAPILPPMPPKPGSEHPDH